MQIPQKYSQLPPAAGSQILPGAPEKIMATADSASLTDGVKSVAQDFLNLVAAQIKLARVELAEDVRIMMSRLLGILVCVPLLLVGYLFGMATIADALAYYGGRTVGLLAVTAFNLIIGGVGMIWVIYKIKRHKILDRTTEELSVGVTEMVNSVTHQEKNSRG